jgi:hypothetical protein
MVQVLIQLNPTFTGRVLPSCIHRSLWPYSITQTVKRNDFSFFSSTKSVWINARSYGEAKKTRSGEKAHKEQ